MTGPAEPTDRAAAVRLIRQLAHAKRIRLAARVQQSLYELDLDSTDILECLQGLAEEEIHSDEPDESHPDKRMIVFHTMYEDRVLYVKVSIRIPKDHDLSVVSFKLK